MLKVFKELQFSMVTYGEFNETFLTVQLIRLLQLTKRERNGSHRESEEKEKGQQEEEERSSSSTYHVMEERSPGGFSPTKWAQFANSPPAWAPRASGGRGRATAAPARARRSPPPDARSRPDFPGGGARQRGRGRRRRGAAAFSSLSGPFPALLRTDGARARLETAARPGGRAGGRVGAESETAPPPRTNKHRRLQPEPAPRPPPPAASFQPGSALQPPPAPPRRDESASLRCSVLPPARRAVAAVAAALGKWRPSSFSLPPFNLKRRENGASERAGERRGHGEEGQQRLRRLRLRRRRAAPPRRAARGRPPRRPRGPPGGAAAAASVMAPRRGRCFCTSICGGRVARPQLPWTCGDGTQHCGRGKPALAAAEEWP
ncbi:hepatoma-derived growth factor-related protein 2-like [Gorilla gorilla gorilla]|uniref:hepatoma-derived growth factor-related protein 2-like n=1 Tax=Gorilla gorilla gorilla TaxID=9595 RepID=UPI003009C5C7